MLNVCCQKQLKSVVRGTSLPNRSPEGGAIKDYRCVPASEEGRKQLDVVLEEFNGIALTSDENEVKRCVCHSYDARDVLNLWRAQPRSVILHY